MILSAQQINEISYMRAMRKIEQHPFLTGFRWAINIQWGLLSIPLLGIVMSSGGGARMGCIAVLLLQFGLIVSMLMSYTWIKNKIVKEVSEQSFADAFLEFSINKAHYRLQFLATGSILSLLLSLIIGGATSYWITPIIPAGIGYGLFLMEKRFQAFHAYLDDAFMDIVKRTGAS